MYTTIRIYRSRELADALIARRSDVERIVQGVPGFRSYQMIRTNDGVCSVTTCDDQNGCEESTRAAAQFIRENLPNIQAGAPEIFSGDVAISFGGALAGV